MQFSSCLNIIFGIGLGFIKSSGSGYNFNNDNNNYMMRQQYDYPRDYHEHQGYYNRDGHNVYMTQLHGYMQQNMSSSYNGPLYQYLHHQQQPNMYHNYMYSQDHQQQKRYGGI